MSKNSARLNFNGKHGLGRKGLIAFACIIVLILAFWVAAEKNYIPLLTASSGGYAGSRSCAECHEKFHQLWSTSFHGLSFQNYTSGFAKSVLASPQKEIMIGGYRYKPNITEKAGWIVEIGPEREKEYKIEQVIGGKNVYYFLGLMEHGRLQALPLAYDVNRKEWFDMAASGTRHFPEGLRPDSPVHWKERPYTFNTACFGCHVSQTQTNYDLKADSYETVWREPGINCETCHGPSEEHNRVMTDFKDRKVPPGTDLKIISFKTLTIRRQNDACNSCHSKAVVLTNDFKPGDHYFDHYDLVALESPDFYPDGRDLGENYTHTTWLMSPCAQSGSLGCMHCHTSSGRYRFKAEEKANAACLPCHRERVENAVSHTNHRPGTTGGRCISCHMPKTEFARMKRSDHSMRPPAPAATLAYKSPNACNSCHIDRDANWADRTVRKWRRRNYQAPILHRASLIDAARKRDWRRLPDMLRFLETGGERDEIFAASLVRLLGACDDPRKDRLILKLVKGRSPLVRAAAAQTAARNPVPRNLRALAEAAGDECRVVRIRAAAGLAGKTGSLNLSEDEKRNCERAAREHFSSLLIPPDHWASYYNEGNYYLGIGDYRRAVEAYETSVKLEPRGILSRVNMSIAYAGRGDLSKAESSLRKSLEMEPGNAAANFNMGLLKAEQQDLKGAEDYLKAALKTDPGMAQAAYNLCLITAKDRISEAVAYCKRAADLHPQDARYGYTLACCQQQNGDRKAAIGTLQKLIKNQPAHAESHLLLGSIHEEQGQDAQAEKVYKKALNNNDIPDKTKLLIAVQLQKLESKKTAKTK